MPAPTEPGRIASLDALRGVAALTVVAHHCLITFYLFYGFYFRGFFHDLDQSPSLADRLAYYLSGSPLHLLWGGQEAVMFFFVLSGFVLALPFTDPERRPRYAVFLIKRFWRIYPAYLVSIAIAAGAKVILAATLPRPSAPVLSAWFSRLWTQPLTWQTVGDHLLMIGDLSAVSSVVWSLIPEMRIAFVFPLLMWLIARRGGLWLLPVSLAVSLAVIPNGGWDNVLAWLPRPLFERIGWLEYLVFFVGGGLIARYKAAIGSVVARMDKTGRFLLLLGSLFALNIRWQWPVYTIANTFLMGLGAAGLIVYVLHSPKAQAWLSHPWLVHLGKISYSLYLVHTTVLLVLMCTLSPFLGFPLTVAPVPLVSLWLAGILYRRVELPAIGIGRRWVSHLRD